jgi:hypothetical protein
LRIGVGDEDRSVTGLFGGFGTSPGAKETEVTGEIYERAATW